MSLSLRLRDDDIERLSQRLGRQVTEDPLSASVPETDQTLRVGVYHGVRRFVQQRGGVAVDLEVRAHGTCSRLSRADSFRRGRTRSASVVLSSTAKNASKAMPRTPCRTQPGSMAQALPAPKQGAMAKSGSVRRTTAPILMVSAGRPG